jgi:hypothetical protein
MAGKSQFEDVCKEDFQQFREISKRFQNIDMTDLDGLNELCIDSWLLATRWSEIQSNSVKLSKEFGINKTDFNTWAYQKYRQLQEMHITVRSWYRMAKEEYKANMMLEG